MSARRAAQLYSVSQSCDSFATICPLPPPPPAGSNILLVVLSVDDGIFPLASGYVAVEQDIDLSVGASLHLWDVEVGENQAEECRASPDVAAFSAEVCALYELLLSVIDRHASMRRTVRTYLWIEHVARQENTWDVYQVVATSPDACGEGPEPNGRGFSYDDP
jgi:hypothetical protein